MKSKLKFISMLIAAFSLIIGITGCAIFSGGGQITDETTIRRYAYSAGVATGAVASLTHVDENVVNTTLSILEKVDESIVTIDQTYSEVWMPEIEIAISEAISEGKLTNEQGVLVKTASLLVVEGIDYMFSLRPEWKSATLLAKYAIDSFTTGVKTAFVAQDETTELLSAPKTYEVDEDVYNDFVRHLKSKHNIN